MEGRTNYGGGIKLGGGGGGGDLEGEQIYLFVTEPTLFNY